MLEEIMNEEFLDVINTLIYASNKLQVGSTLGDLHSNTSYSKCIVTFMETQIKLTTDSLPEVKEARVQ